MGVVAHLGSAWGEIEVIIWVAKSDMTGGKSGSHPDYSNKHTRTLIN